MKAVKIKFNLFVYKISSCLVPSHICCTSLSCIFTAPQSTGHVFVLSKITQELRQYNINVINGINSYFRMLIMRFHKYPTLESSPALRAVPSFHWIKMFNSRAAGGGGDRIR